jgi:hypothetical protein
MRCKGCISFRLLFYTKHMNNRHTDTCQSAMEFICCQLVKDLYIQFILFKLSTKRIRMIILVSANFYHPLSQPSLSTGPVSSMVASLKSVSVLHTHDLSFLQEKSKRTRARKLNFIQSFSSAITANK